MDRAGSSSSMNQSQNGSQSEPFFDFVESSRNHKSQPVYTFENEDAVRNLEFQPFGKAMDDNRGWTTSQAANHRNSAPTYELDVRHEKDVVETATVAAVERTMKKYADNLLRVLEGMSGRLTQLESNSLRMEHLVGKIVVEAADNHGATDGKLRALENMIREVQRGVQVLRDKQEIAEEQAHLAKLQLNRKPEPPVSVPIPLREAIEAPTLSVQPVEALMVPSTQPATPLQNQPQQLHFQAHQLPVPPQPPQIVAPQMQPQMQNQQLQIQGPPQAPQHQQVQLQGQPPQPHHQMQGQAPPTQHQTLQMQGQAPPTQQQQAQIQGPQTSQQAPQGYQPPYLPQHPQVHLQAPSVNPQPEPQYQPQQSQPLPLQQPFYAPQQQQQQGPPPPAMPQHYGNPNQEFNAYGPPQGGNYKQELPPPYMPVGYGNRPLPPQQQNLQQMPANPHPQLGPMGTQMFEPGHYHPQGQSAPQMYDQYAPPQYRMTQQPATPLAPNSHSGGYSQLPTAQPVQQRPPPMGPHGGGPSGAPISANRVPVEEVVDGVASMGFSKDQVRAVVRRLTENGQSVDLNTVLDKLMNGGGGDGQQPPKGRYSR